VLDAIYSPYETKLLQDAKEQGATIIHGTEMLLHQGVAQFELYTGKKGPVEVMREVLEIAV
jgi:shikimate dehydrogenase